MPVCIEDECNSELPPASLLFRTARQYAYGVLFSLAETQRRLERLALRKRAPLEGKPRPPPCPDPVIKPPTSSRRGGGASCSGVLCCVLQFLRSSLRSGAAAKPSPP